MIRIEQLVYKSRLRANKLATNDHQEIPIEDLILIIREAHIKLVKKKADKLDSSRKRYEDLEFLIEPAEKHELSLELVNKQTYRYKAVLSNLTPKYMYYIDSYLIADKGECKDRVVWVNSDLVGHANIPTLLNNSNYKPSFEYQETFNDEFEGELGFYTDGTFIPTKAFVSYLRYPVNVDVEGYEDFDGNPSKTTHSEFYEYLEDELLDIITQDIAQYTENPSAYQASAQSRANTE